MSRLEKTSRGRIGSVARRSMRAKATRSAPPTAKEPTPPRAPGPRLAALEHGEDEQRQRDGQHDRAGVVDVVLSALDRLVVVAPQHPGGQQAEGDVEEEDPAPGGELGEDAAERRADDGGDGPHARDVALGLGPLGDGVDVAGDRRGQWQDGSGAEALKSPHRDERAHAPSESAQDGTDEEEPDAEEDDRLAPHRVGELGVDRTDTACASRYTEKSHGNSVRP